MLSLAALTPLCCQVQKTTFTKSCRTWRSSCDVNFCRHESSKERKSLHVAVRTLNSRSTNKPSTAPPFLSMMRILYVLPASYMDWMRSDNSALRGVADTPVLAVFPRSSRVPLPLPPCLSPPTWRISARCPYTSPADVAWTNHRPYQGKTRTTPANGGYKN